MQARLYLFSFHESSPLRLVFQLRWQLQAEKTEIHDEIRRSAADVDFMRGRIKLQIWVCHQRKMYSSNPTQILQKYCERQQQETNLQKDPIKNMNLLSRSALETCSAVGTAEAHYLNFNPRTIKNPCLKLKQIKNLQTLLNCKFVSNSIIQVYSFVFFFFSVRHAY